MEIGSGNGRGVIEPSGARWRDGLPADHRGLAQAARRVVEETQAGLRRADGWLLKQTRERLSVSLGSSLTDRELGVVLAEVAALSRVEGEGDALRLPEPLRPLESLLERPGCGALEAVLEALQGLAARVGESGGRMEDLYEGFLAELDPEARSRRSVYLTPAPLVRMLVESVDEVVTDALGIEPGLADPEVGLLDPATGTGAFLLTALERRSRQGEGATRPRALWQGFEVQPGAHVAATLRLGRRLARQTGGCPSDPSPSDPTVRLHLRDLLAADSPLAGPPEMRWGEPRPSALVVLGNPPWSGTGSSSTWVAELLRAGYRRPDGSRDDGYYRCGGRQLSGRTTKWLGSRYVKFLRVAQWSVDQVGRGVVALVLPDGIADNLTMSGLRESLLGSFESVYLLDLGGSARKQASQGPDPNLFDIQQGVCVLILVKGAAARGVWGFKLRGSREEKLSWLATHTVCSTPWRRIEPQAPSHAFVAASSVRRPSAGWAPSVPEIFPQGSVAVITCRDRVVVGFEAGELAGRISLLREGGDAAFFGLKRTGDFDPEEAVRALAEDEEWERHLVPYLIRPGDRRVLFSAPYFVSRPRRAVMEEIERPGNSALLLPRRRRAFPSAWVTESRASHRVASAYEGSYAFPLYLGPERRPNLASEVLDRLAERYGSPPAPEEVLGYVYARLWSRGFEERNGDLLRLDWPRVAFPASVETFTARAGLGWRLALVHLGWERGGARPWFHGELPVRLPPRGPVFEHDRDGRLHLGLGGYLAPVGSEAIKMEIGGYPVISGWIRRRAGRRLGAHDIEELCRLVETLEATRRLERDLAGLEE